MKELDLLQERLHADAGVVPDPGNVRLKRFLLFGMIGRQEAGAISAAFTTQLMPLYRQRTADFWAALADAPVLVAPSCHFLGKYFGFEDRETGGKPAFVATAAPLLERALAADDAALCKSEIDAARP